MTEKFYRKSVRRQKKLGWPCIWMIKSKMKKSNPLGKYGLTGLSGLLAFPGIFHLNAPYDACGKVFVEWKYRRAGEVCDGWKRMTLAKARKEGRKIIRCSMKGCLQPAISLDHLWPYYNERNLCKKHWEGEAK